MSYFSLDDDFFPPQIILTCFKVDNLFDPFIRGIL